jgi:Protein of unknown function (DUF997)
MARSPEDPVLQSSRREAFFVMLLWLAALVYSLTYCSAYGYDRDVASFTFVLGFPDWVFWGIVVPWAVCVAISGWFSFWFMRDEPLGDEPEGANGEETGPEANHG